MSDDAQELSHIPGDEGPPIIGQSLAILRDPRGFDRKMIARFGPVYRARFLGRCNVNLTSMEGVGGALLDRARNLSSKHGWGATLGKLFSNGLMLRDFDDHQRHRKFMQFAFRGTARRAYHGRLERHASAQLAQWDQGESFEFYPRLKRALLEQAGRVFLGIEDGAKVLRLLDSFVAMSRASVAVVRVPLPGSAWRRGQIGRRRLQAFFRAEIPRRRASGGEDLFSVLCQAEDDAGERLSEDDIVDHMIFLLFASHDTTATTIATLVDELTAAPQLQDRAARECELLAARSGGVLRYDELDALEYIDCCTREALRLNPAVPYIVRRTVSACPVAGHELPARAPVVLHVGMVHRDPELWPDPDRFDPERFTDPEQVRARPAHAWMPFGGGAHRCIGAELARQQIKVFMFHLLTRYRIQRVHDVPTPWRVLPLPAPTNGLPVRIAPRSGATTSTPFD